MPQSGVMEALQKALDFRYSKLDEDTQPYYDSFSRQVQPDPAEAEFDDVIGASAAEMGASMRELNRGTLDPVHDTGTNIYVRRGASPAGIYDQMLGLAGTPQRDQFDHEQGVSSEPWLIAPEEMVQPPIKPPALENDPIYRAYTTNDWTQRRPWENRLRRLVRKRATLEDPELGVGGELGIGMAPTQDPRREMLHMVGRFQDEGTPELGPYNRLLLEEAALREALHTEPTQQELPLNVYQFRPR